MSFEITKANISAAKVFVGIDEERVMGAAEEYFTISKMSDIGGVIEGAQGDTMHFGVTGNAYSMTLNVIPASSAVRTVLKQVNQTGNAFRISISFNDFSLTGIATLINPGEWTASRTPAASRSMTLGISKITGNTDTGIGEVEQLVV